MVPQYLDSQQGGPNAYDGGADSFWGTRDHLRAVPDIVSTGIPALLWNGWNDSGFGGLELYSALQNQATRGEAHLNWWAPHPGDPSTGRYQLILGDWAHGGGLDEGIELQWYDTWLKNSKTGMPINTKTPVHVQDRVTRQWRNLGAYPFTMQATRISLAPAGTPARALSFGPAETPGTTLTFDLDRLTNDEVLAGPSALHVEASSTAKDVMLRAELYDVAADDSATLVTWGSVLGSMRTTSATRSWSASNKLPLRPFLSLTRSTDVPTGQTIGYDIPLDPTLWTVRKGHHLRLRLQTQPEQSLCEQKRREITTSAVGCRPRVGVLANLIGGTYLISMSGTYLNLPLVSPTDLGPTFDGVAADGRPEPLPIVW